MADNTDLQVVAEIDDIRDDIALNEGLLASLREYENEESDDENSKKVIKSHLKALNKRLRALQATHEEHRSPNQQDRPRSPDEAVERPGSSHSMSLPGSMQHSSSSQASRKRPREDSFRDDGVIMSSKSRRTTPSSAMSDAPSPADTTDSFDSSDLPLLDSLFDSKQEARRMRDLHKRHEERKRQEEADAEFARSLSQQWSQHEPGRSTPEPHTSNRPLDYTQALFRNDGTINRRFGAAGMTGTGAASSMSSKQDQTPKAEQMPPMQSRPSLSQGLSPSYGAAMSGRTIPLRQEPTLLNGSSSTHIKYEPLTSHHAPTMPGSFPAQYPLASIGGTSVYTSPFTSATSALNSSPQTYGPALTYNGRPTTQPGLMPGEMTADRLAYLRAEAGDSANTKEEIENLLKHIRPDEEFTTGQLAAQPQYLDATLMAHQQYGLTWMIKMEEGTNKGGILADDMGLGKTIQSIALMLSRPPSEGNLRPTLVVAPVALMQQWQRELEKMVHHRHPLDVLVLHGEKRTTTWSNLKAYDVVLTTYGRLASELKRKAAWDEKVKRVPDARPSPAEECPILGDRSHFHRVILDEAQNIKSQKAKSALAACQIKSDHRWALTGTPMQNNVEELFSLVKFCRIRPYCEWNQFKNHISAPLKGRWQEAKDKAMVTLQAFLRAILLRRTKKSKINGQPILQLPPKTTIEDRVIFSSDELTFYKGLEKQAQIQINKYLRNGSIGRNYSHALVLLLRLRQACCHPHLVTSSKDFSQTAGNLDTNDLITNARELDAKVVDRLKKEEHSFDCPICMDVDENPALFPCGHTLCNDCLSRLVDQAANDTEARPKCPHCRAQIDANKITDVVSFNRVHCPDKEGVEPLRDEDDLESDTCSDTDSESDDEDDSDDGDDLNGFIVPDNFEDDSALDSDVKGKKPAKAQKSFDSKKHKKRSKPKNRMKSRDAFKSLAELRKDGLQNRQAKRKYLRRLQKNYQPSAKIEKTMELLEEIRDRGENEKTIIFSFFTSFLDLLEVPLNKSKDFRRYVRYDGSMSSNHRNAAVLEFTESPKCTVILVSLKAGNAGLNLTTANHVIMLDPFWNPFVEYQAADRCHRIGQKREVTVHRVLIGEGEGATKESESEGFTVEDRILALQEKKKQLVETALDEAAGRGVARLGVRELGYLFGINGLD
ncbi:adenosinetriphosphatase [Exophiala viscosa]|uniref:Adenosinetriphosphatase n=1 Tax=Exophiala viscosa TaxID=2486360 RepID=A0AAN6DSP2_9EURO|nr:adenosinetriphosphatase [Exophiala viscosa]